VAAPALQPSIFDFPDDLVLVLVLVLVLATPGVTPAVWIWLRIIGFFAGVPDGGSAAVARLVSLPRATYQGDPTVKSAGLCVRKRLGFSSPLGTESLNQFQSSSFSPSERNPVEQSDDDVPSVLTIQRDLGGIHRLGVVGYNGESLWIQDTSLEIDSVRLFRRECIASEPQLCLISFEYEVAGIPMFQSCSG